MAHTEHVEECIRWRIGRHFSTMPIGHTCFFEQVPDKLRRAIKEVIRSYELGTPVLAAVDSTECWTVIGTSALVSKSAGKICQCKHFEISDVCNRDRMPNGLTFEEKERWKVSWEYLRISDRAGNHFDIWVPKGTEGYAFWNTILMLGRMCGGMTLN